MFIDLPKKAHDLAGRVFGQLRVLGPIEIKRYPNVTHVVWMCECSCGAATRTTTGRLKNGMTKSCGCLRKTSMTGLTHGYAKTKTGVRAPEYRVWCHMICRCHNARDKAFHNYGGRGITVCDEWRSDFVAFLSHIGPRPSARHSIDRIDNNDGYRPGNVRWALPLVQNTNTRKNKFLTAHGETLTISQWARRVGSPVSQLQARLKRGWTHEDAIFKPRMKSRFG